MKKKRLKLEACEKPGGGFTYFSFSPRKLRKMNPFWLYHIFSKGLVKNHQLEKVAWIFDAHFHVEIVFPYLRRTRWGFTGISLLKGKMSCCHPMQAWWLNFVGNRDVLPKTLKESWAKLVPSGKLTWLAGKWSCWRCIPYWKWWLFHFHVSLLKGISTSKRWRISILKSWSFGAFAIFHSASQLPAATKIQKLPPFPSRSRG